MFEDTTQLREDIDALVKNADNLRSYIAILESRIKELEVIVSHHRHLGQDKTSTLLYPTSLGYTDGFSTTETYGFPVMPSCAGAPTGTPTFLGESSLGIPFLYDRTNNKLYAYNGAWKSVTLA